MKKRNIENSTFRRNESPLVFYNYHYYDYYCILIMTSIIIITRIFMIKIDNLLFLFKKFFSTTIHNNAAIGEFTKMSG